VSANISVFGLGYTGSVSAALFASMGHTVIGVDLNPAKVETLASGRSPIIEAQMPELVAKAHAAGRLHATVDPVEAVRQSDVSFVCVGTPSLRNGQIDLTHVLKVAGEIGSAIRRKKTPHSVVLRSTVLPGTTQSSVIPVLEKESGHRNGDGFMVCYNPEFMREGSAVTDFLHPPYTVLGAVDAKHLSKVRDLYKTIPGGVFETTIPVAEMVKYVSNAFHAVKVGFANEIGTLCKHLGVDAEAVTEIFISDQKLNISPAYLLPGFAFGGSCLPKDLRALAHRAKELDVTLPFLDALIPSNAEHVNRAVDAVLRTQKRKVAMLGLSFKAGTDDLRESPQVDLIKKLLGEGCQLKVWDEDVLLGRLAGSNRQYIEEVIPHIGLLLSGDLDEVVRFAEVVVVGTESVTRDRLAGLLAPHQIVIDLVNLKKSQRLQGHAGYEGICW
jgi:GDP-mannose 6-dehydrogenase